MNRLTRWVTRLYAGLLRLAERPHDFLVEFGDEMQRVFADATGEAIAQDRVMLLALLGRELRDVPRHALREQWRSVATRGVLVYMRATQEWQRALALLIAVLVCWLAATVFAAAYWSVPHEQGPAWVTPWGSTVRNMLTMGGGILVVMFAPALLGLVHRAVNALRPA